LKTATIVLLTNLKNKINVIIALQAISTLLPQIAPNVVTRFQVANIATSKIGEMTKV